MIVYKLGPAAAELTNLEASVWRLDRYFNAARRYPVVVFHDEPLARAVEARVSSLSSGSLSFARLANELPAGLPREMAPAQARSHPRSPEISPEITRDLTGDHPRWHRRRCTASTSRTG